MGFDDEQRFEHEEFRKTFVLNETELLTLLVDLEKSGFYSLNDSYVNNEIMDGYSEFISITKEQCNKIGSRIKHGKLLHPTKKRLKS